MAGCVSWIALRSGWGWILGELNGTEGWVGLDFGKLDGGWGWIERIAGQVTEDAFSFPPTFFVCSLVCLQWMRPSSSTWSW